MFCLINVQVVTLYINFAVRFGFYNLQQNVFLSFARQAEIFFLMWNVMGVPLHFIYKYDRYADK